MVAHGELKHRLDGPAETGDGGIAHEQALEVDGEQVGSASDEEIDGEQFHAALPDEEYPQEALPTMHFCADALTSMSSRPFGKSTLSLRFRS